MYILVSWPFHDCTATPLLSHHRGLVALDYQPTYNIACHSHQSDISRYRAYDCLKSDFYDDSIIHYRCWEVLIFVYYQLSVGVDDIISNRLVARQRPYSVFIYLFAVHFIHTLCFIPNYNITHPTIRPFTTAWRHLFIECLYKYNTPLFTIASDDTKGYLFLIMPQFHSSTVIKNDLSFDRAARDMV